jgi:hypothetical protein
MIQLYGSTLSGYELTELSSASDEKTNNFSSPNTVVKYLARCVIYEQHNCQCTFVVRGWSTSYSIYSYELNDMFRPHRDHCQVHVIQIIRLSIPGWDQRIFCFPQRSDWLWSPHSLVSSGHQKQFPGGKQSGREGNLSPPFNVEVKYAWNWTTRWFFIAYSINKHRDTFLLAVSTFPWRCWEKTRTLFMIAGFGMDIRNLEPPNRKQDS